ncbi:hypothetical protein ACQ5SO_13205 [Rhodovulum sp. DZ06]|uniref:hypothetical protein n=1 Tax=Rhodovulum sp. DZ06 TaxID=3425126 RepID=UPI003D350E4E
MIHTDIGRAAQPHLAGLELPAALLSGAQDGFRAVEANGPFKTIFGAACIGAGWRGLLDEAAATGAGPARAAEALRKALIAHAPQLAILPLPDAGEHLVAHLPARGGHGDSVAVMVTAAALPRTGRLAAAQERLAALRGIVAEINRDLAAARLPAFDAEAIDGFDAFALAFARLRSLP